VLVGLGLRRSGLNLENGDVMCFTSPNKACNNT